LPDISKWNLINAKDISQLFWGCSLLNEIPDISKWNLINVYNISYLFAKCTSLKELPDISKWYLSNVSHLDGLFFYCSSLISLPDISKWDIFNSNINNYKLESEFESKIPFENINEENFKSISSYVIENFNNDLYLENINFEMPELKSYNKEELKNYF